MVDLDQLQKILGLTFKSPALLQTALTHSSYINESPGVFTFSNERLELLGDLPQIQADASLLKQVFLNLIKNSADVCGSGGELVVKTESIPPFVKISFSDNGPGIPADLLNRIFEPFFTTKATGMGMGLATCQRIFQTHEGRIEANNLLPRGAQFNIFLPV